MLSEPEMSNLEAIVVLPDMQIPYHDEPKINKVIDFIHKFQPVAVGHVGDFTDSTQIGRWTRGLRGEFDGGLEGAFKQTRSILERLRSGYGGPIHLVRSNHDERLEKAIEQRLPGIAQITINGSLLNIQNALQLDKFGVTWHDKPYQLAPGWLLQHGDEGKFSAIPGNTALLLSQQSGLSTVCGHTHRGGLAATTRGWNGNRTTLYGLEVGHLCSYEKMEYLGPARYNNWSQGFGVLWIHKVPKKKIQVYPEFVPVLPDGSFVVGGQRY
jgi:predicted phosphodiesterase